MHKPRLQYFVNYVLVSIINAVRVNTNQQSQNPLYLSANF